MIDEVALYSGPSPDPEIAALYVGSIATPTPTATRTATPTPTATVTATRTPTPVATAPAPTATPTPAGPEAALDDFHCFGIKPAKGAPKFAAVAGVAVTTDVDDTGVVVKGPRQLCLPSDQTLGAIHDAATHLESFQIALAKGAPKPQKHGHRRHESARSTHRRHLQARCLARADREGPPKIRRRRRTPPPTR